MPNQTTLFLSYWYPNKHNGMAGIFVKKHAQAIATKQPLVVLALSIHPGNKFYTCEKNVFMDEAGIETHQISITSRFYKVLYLLLPWQYWLLKRYIGQNILPAHHIQRLHGNILFPCGIITYWLAKWLNTPYLLTEHWSKVSKFFRVSLYARAGKKAYDRASAITCVSGQLAKTIAKHSTNPRLHIIPNIIDSADFFLDAGVKKNEQFTFIAVAHWGREKNPFLFLNALEELWLENKLRNFQVSLVGEGEKIALVKKNTYSFPIVFKSQLSPQEVCSELNASHIFLHGSDFETFSVIMAEALMCGLPSVVSPVGISAEVINPQNGFIAQNTVADWKEKIMRCYHKQYNPKEISEQLKGRYDQKTVADQFNELYR